MQIFPATHEDKIELLEFMETRDPAKNVWLVSSITDAMECDDPVEDILLCRDDQKLTGVACFFWSCGRVGENCQVRLETENQESLLALLDALPESKSLRIPIINAEVQQYMDSIHGFEREDGDLYFTAVPEQFQPVAVSSDNIIEVTEDLKHLFEGCENPPRWGMYRAPYSRIDAYLINDRVASSVSSGPHSTVLPSGHRLYTVGALYTQTKYRRKGYARELVSLVTQRILSGGNIPIYWTQLENIASQSLCKSLGYYQYAREAHYCW